jgi:cell fate (sporulation/competence/biofilm development) regulator YlbF (YheA/YmcA/DUF963 family)
LLALFDGVPPDNDRLKEPIMQTTTDETVIIAKTRELCQTILDQPEYQSIRRRVDAFMGDEAAKSQYQTVVEKGDALQQKQQFGLPLDGEEINEFERNRESLLKNPVAQDFLDAQQDIHQIRESVLQFVTKTFELGRVPTTDDFTSGSCGPSCGCGH